VSKFQRTVGWDAQTYQKVDIPEDNVYYCSRCKQDRELFQKMFCWLCAKCRVVLINA